MPRQVPLMLVRLCRVVLHFILSVSMPYLWEAVYSSCSSGVVKSVHGKVDSGINGASPQCSCFVGHKFAEEGVQGFMRPFCR